MSSTMRSRCSSVSSMRSLKGAGGGPKPPSFVCRHPDAATSRLNAALAQLPLASGAAALPRTRKCFECQTAVPETTLALLAALQEMPAGEVDGRAARRAAELLFERLAGQRRRPEFKAGGVWADLELAFAFACHARVPVRELAALCQTVKARFGAGVDRQLLRALAEAACRAHEVWDPVGEPGSEVFAGINAFVAKLRRQVERVDRFAHVEDIFAIAEELGNLSNETVSVLCKVDARLARWKV
ncbi:hypothetical protein F4780DRAFT_777842 [Xylariomycetidae sp. FL0641]|nr:hypothetical protein F4780DRAFT_777842 [Xylariomycetidae sp. FL0641]